MNVMELRKVSLHFRYPDGSTSLHPSEQWMHHSQVETFLKASIELHHNPGINPHVQAEIDRDIAAGRVAATQTDRTSKTSSLWFVKVHRFLTDSLGNPETWAIWHTTPGLGFGLPHGTAKSHIYQYGAKVLKLWREERIWAHPDLLAEEVEQEKREEAFEAQNEL